MTTNCAANSRAAAGADPAPHPVGGRDPPSRLCAPERGLSKPTQRGRGEISADRLSRAYPGFPEPRRLLPWTSTTLPSVPFIAFNMTRPLFTTGVGVSCPGGGQLRRPRPRSSFWPFCWTPLARPAAAPSAWWAPPSGRLARVRRPLPAAPAAAPGRGHHKNPFRRSLSLRLARRPPRRLGRRWGSTSFPNLFRQSLYPRLARRPPRRLGRH